jgi:catechol 2,3-dioxygenase-like lactoylglutathione lyase family enzyme
MMLDVLHFSFTVRDIDASIAWYTEVLGLELVHRQHQDNEYTRTLVGVPGAVLETAQLKIPDVSPGLSSHMLELVQYVRAGEIPPAPININCVGAPHLGFLVADVAERYERLRAQGVQFANPPVEITAGINTGGFACYFWDIDRITLELLQPPPARLAAMLDR